MMKYILLIIAFSFLPSIVLSYNVTASLRNEFQQTISLVKAELSQGDWVIKPSSSVQVSNNYIRLFQVSGDQIQGHVDYQTGENGAHASFYFQIIPGNVTYWVNVKPVPFIGGVGDVTSSSVQYWIHQMCSVMSNGVCKQ